MKAIKRLEIIVERAERQLVIDILVAAGVDGWTILPVLSGQGNRGSRGVDGLPGSLENDLILTTIAEASIRGLIEQLRPVLARWGGVCLVSDAQWLIHDRI